MPFLNWREITSWGLKKPDRPLTSAALAAGFTVRKRGAIVAAFSFSFCWACNITRAVAGVVPGVPTELPICLKAFATSASTVDANWLIRGFKTRSAKSSNCMVSSAEVKLMPTCFCEATVRVVYCSLSSWACRAAPSVTRARSGRRIRRVEPILAPSTAKLSSYWRFTLRVITRLFSRISRDLRVIMSMVRRLFAMIEMSYLTVAECLCFGDLPLTLGCGPFRCAHGLGRPRIGGVSDTGVHSAGTHRANRFGRRRCFLLGRLRCQFGFDLPNLTRLQERRQTRDAISFFRVAAQPVGQIRSEVGRLDCFGNYIGDSKLGVVGDLLEVVILTTGFFLTLCVGVLNLSALLLEFSLRNQFFGLPDSQCFRIGFRGRKLVRWREFRWHRLRSLPFGQLCLLLTFPLTLLSCEAFANHCIEFSLSEFLLLCCLAALISDFRRVLCLTRGGRHLGNFKRRSLSDKECFREE